MSMSSDITIGTGETEIVYSSTVIKPSSTLRADATRKIIDPGTLLISHETARNGKVSSVIIIDDTATVPCNDTCSVTPGISNVRGMIKLQYDPTSGRDDLEATFLIVIEQLRLLLTDAQLMAKFTNREH